MRRSTLTVLLACALPIASCASRTPRLGDAPKIEMPAEAARACDLYRLPEAPTLADLEIGYVRRGAQIVACDAARRLAVETHRAEHELDPTRSR
jgi:hypothetical protein